MNFCAAQVREKDLSVVIHTLAEEFNIFREVNGESVPEHCPDVNNGLHGNGREGETKLPRPSPSIHITNKAPSIHCMCVCMLPVPRSTLHPVLIPKNQFCVMSLDPDTLPGIATTLIEVLFYSNRFAAFKLPVHIWKSLSKLIHNRRGNEYV